MKPEIRRYNLYHNIGYWFLLFILLVIAGFYHTYLSVFFQPKLSIVHIHFALMSLWVVMLITQPFLIKYKRLALHRIVGRISYVVIPLVVVSAVLMMRVGYLNTIERLSHETANGGLMYSTEEVQHVAARSIALPFFYTLWLIVFYALAILNRKRSAVHARYMLATALTLLGPTIDRFLYFGLNVQTLPFNVPLETFAFILINTILIALVATDVVHKRSPMTLTICLTVYVMSQILYFVIQDTTWWEYGVRGVLHSTL